MNIVAVVGLRWIARSARARRAVGLALDSRLAGVLHSAGARADRAVEPPSGTGRHLRLGAARVRPAARLRLRLVHVGQQPVLLPVAAAVCRGELRARARRRRRGPRRQPSLLGRSSCSASSGSAPALNIIGLAAGKWLQHLGSVATWIPAALLIVCGAIAFATFGSATSFAPVRARAARRPADDDEPVVVDVLRVLRVRDRVDGRPGGEEPAAHDSARASSSPASPSPRSTFSSSASVLVAVPASELAERSGIADAVDLVTGRLGLAGHGRADRPAAGRRRRSAARTRGWLARRACRLPPASTPCCRARSRGCTRAIARRTSR